MISILRSKNYNYQFQNQLTQILKASIIAKKQRISYISIKNNTQLQLGKMKRGLNQVSHNIYNNQKMISLQILIAHKDNLVK